MGSHPHCSAGPQRSRGVGGANASSRAAGLTWAIAPPGEVWPHPLVFLVVTSGSSGFWHLVGGDQGCCKAPYSTQDDPHHKQ